MAAEANEDELLAYDSEPEEEVSVPYGFIQKLLHTGGLYFREHLKLYDQKNV